MLLTTLVHDGRPLAPHDLPGAWSWEPAVVAGLLVSAWLYGSGLRRLWRQAAPGRGIRTWEAGAFAAGWLALLVALTSPLHRLGGVLFSAHMAQHELLMVVAAPLLVLGRPLVPFLWAVPVGWRRAAGRWAGAEPVRSTWRVLTRPVVAWAAHALAIWLWHAPALYQATLRSELVHSLQHTTFLASALLFWWALIHGHRGRLGHGAAVLYVFTTAVHTSLLGVLLSFADVVWYPIYRTTTAPWGLTPLEDQQLAGLIMWIPAGVAYALAALGLCASWLERPAPQLVRGVALPSLLLGAVLLAGAGCTPDVARHDREAEAAVLTQGGNPGRGKVAIERYGCAACHTIPGVAGANGLVGPPLAGIAARAYIAGVLTNTPDHLMRWIEDPPGVDSLTAMPNLGVTGADARDIASYLYTLR